MPYRAFERGIWRTGYLVAFILTLFTSGSLVAERLARGASSVSWLCTATITFGAIVCAISVDVLSGPRAAPADGMRRKLASAHVVGAISAILLVHVILRLPGPFLDRILVERPKQLVNDLVLVGSVLGLAWSLGAATRFVRLGLPIACFGVLALYDATAPQWHLDAFPGFAVQRYVVQQCLVTAGALLLFHIARPPRRQTS